MKTTTVEIEDKVDELLILLDRDIQHMQQNLSWLNELRVLVVKREETDLGKLLGSIQTESDSCRGCCRNVQNHQHQYGSGGPSSFRGKRIRSA